MDLTLLRMSGGVLVPSTPVDAEVIRLMPIGTTIQAQGRGRRNPAFHRRFFALLNLTFDYWEPTGGLVSPSRAGDFGSLCSLPLTLRCHPYLGPSQRRVHRPTSLPPGRAPWPPGREVIRGDAQMAYR